jgi:serine/threonine protein kinase
MSAVSPETRELSRDPSPARRPEYSGAVLLNTGAIIDDRYQIVRTIGQGGMGRVVEVVRLQDRARLALKYCTGLGLGRRRLVREARILSGLDHPHLLPVLDARLDHEPPYFVMPVAAATLDRELSRRAGDLRWTIAVFRDVCLGVQALHRAGVVHRDLKPSNILRMDDGRHVVADLGTAKREPRDSTILTRTCAVLGTLSYLAPEQLLPGGSRQADARTDVFQLGKLLYQLLTGRSPALIEEDSLPPALARVVRRATAPLPDDRYPEVAALLEAVERWAGAQGHEDADPATITAAELLAGLGQLSATTPQGRAIHPEEILELLAGLAYLGDDYVLEVFDQLPAGLLAALARQSAGRFLSRLRTYTRSLERAGGRRNFTYADRVADRMREIIAADPVPEVVAQAVEAMLVAAVVLNRYSAMARVKQTLYQIRGDGAALAVSEMLRERRDYFQEIAPFLRPDRLHSILRRVIDDLEWIETVTF